MALSMVRRSVVVGLMAVLVGVEAAAADEAASPALGTRVRVTAPRVLGKRVVGTLVGLDAATLTLQPKGSTRTIEVPRAAITRLEASRRPSQRGKGAGLGLLAGLGAAAVIGVMAGDTCGPDSWLCFDKTATAAMAAVLTVPVGVLVGVGAARGERWEIYDSPRVHVGLGPVRGGGVRGEASVRF